MKSEKKHKKYFADYVLFSSLFLLGLLLRGLFFYVFTQHEQRAWLCYDSAQYQERALLLSVDGHLTAPESNQKAYRLPGYPLFLASIYALTNNNVKTALGLQILLAAAVPPLVFVLANVLFPGLPSVAFFAMGLACVHFGMILFAGMLATETLALLLLLLFLLCLLWYNKKRQWRMLMIAASLLAMLSLVRPVGHYLLLPIVCWLWWQGATIKRLSVFLAMWGVLVAPWLVRNLLVTGGICFHTLPGIHFLQYTAVPVVMQRDGCEHVEAREKLLLQRQKEALDQGITSEYGLCILAEKISLRYIKQYPLYAFRHMAKELFKTLCSLHASQITLADVGGWPSYTSKTTWYEKIAYNLRPPLKTAWLQWLIYWDVFLAIFLLLGSFFGVLLLLLYRKITADLVLCGLLAALLFGLTIAYGCARLRLPLEPIMIILTAYGACYVWRWLVTKIS
jgi:hypothetical protein